MTNEELQVIEEELKEKSKKINELKAMRLELLEIPEVKKFYEVDEEYRNLEKETDIVSKKVYHARQELCTHPVWYFKGAFKDDYEGRIYWNCMCMKCGKVEERRSRDFDKDSVIYKDMCFGKPKNIDIDFYHTGNLYGKFMNLGNNKFNEEEKSKRFVKMMKRKDVQERLNRTK